MSSNTKAVIIIAVLGLLYVCGRVYDKVSTDMESTPKQEERCVAIVTTDRAFSPAAGEMAGGKKTHWSGSFGARTVDGVGDQTVEFDCRYSCVVVQKKGMFGRLTVTVQPGGESVWTEAEYGVVTTCRR